MDVHHSKKSFTHFSCTMFLECTLLHVGLVACYGRQIWHRVLIRLAAVTRNGLSLQDAHYKCFDTSGSTKQVCNVAEPVGEGETICINVACLLDMVVNIQEASAQPSFPMAHILQRAESLHSDLSLT